MTVNPIWITAQGGPPAGGSATPIWIASEGVATAVAATEAQIAGYGPTPIGGATPVWVASYGGAPPVAIGAAPYWISGLGGGGGGASAPSSVWSAADAAANGMTLTNGGLTVTPSGVLSWQTIRGSIGKTSGKLYIEFADSGTPTNDVIGFGSSGMTIANYLGASNYSAGMFLSPSAPVVSSGFTENYNQPGGAVANDVWALAIDFAAGSIWVAQNNVWANSSNPATGSLPIISFVPATVGALFPGMSFYSEPAGVWTLQPTAASQKYAPPAGFSAWDGASGGHSPQAIAYLARTVGGNEGGNGANIATLIDGLVADGVWAKLDALYVLAQQNQTDARLNLISASYPLASGGSTFTTLVGFHGFSPGMNSGFNPSTAPSPKYTLNSASISGWTYIEIPNNDGFLIGMVVNQTGIFDNYSGASAVYLNGPSIGIELTLSAGLYAGDLTGSTVNSYLNGVHGGSFTGTAVLANANFTIGNESGGAYPTSETVSAASIGGSLGAAGNLALYNRLRTYMTAIGVP